MRITADTNVLVRVIVRDDVRQAKAALQVLADAEAVFLPLPCLCEFAWVVERTFGFSKRDVASSLREIVRRANVETDTHAVEVGLGMLESGGDFADGAIAAAGARMGADRLVSFDRKAVACLKSLGLSAELPVEEA